MSRQFDSYYDPVYSSAAPKAVPEFRNKVILPHYPNMFSEGKNFPAKSVLVRTQTLANDQPLPGTTMISKTNVGGPDRFRYFGQPLVPYVPTFALGYNSGADASTSNRKPLLNNNNATKANPPTTAASQHSSNSKGQQTNDHKSQPAADDWYTKYSQMDAMIEFVVGDQFRTVGVQTVYRESDAQTMPYSPAYVISKLQPQGTIPELVRLGHLTWGNGLPITKDELDLIEREQQKRKWFETLPPATTDSQREIVIEQRSKREAEDWEFRESQIKRLQDERLELVKQVIREKNARLQEMHHVRIERVWQSKLQERESLRNKIDKQRQKLLKILSDKRAKFNNQITVTRRDIIAEHDQAKDMARIAVRGPIKIVEHPTKDKDLDKALQNVTITDITGKSSNSQKKQAGPSTTANPHSTLAIDEQNWQKTINNIYQDIQDQKVARPETQELRLLQPVIKPPARPETPQLEKLDEDYDKKTRAALILQRLMRGRAAQNVMHEGKCRRLDLINELRYRDALSLSLSVGSLQDLSGLTAVVKKAESQQQLNDNSALADTLDTLFESNVQAEYIGKRLNFLTHQLNRLRELRRINALVELAERTRDKREAEEIALRKKEIQAKAEKDYVWSRVMDVHSETVESYLESVLMESVGDVSTEQAKRQVWEDIEKTRAIVDSMRPSSDKASSEDQDEQIVRDLMSAFLLPEVDRQTARQRLEQHQSKYWAAAKKTLDQLTSSSSTQ